MPNKYLDSVGLAEYTTLIKTALDDKADLASPALTGTPTAPTPTAGDDSTKIATTAFVQDEVANYLPLTGGSVTGNLTVSGTITGNVTGNVTGTASGNLPLSGGTITGNTQLKGSYTKGASSGTGRKIDWVDNDGTLIARIEGYVASGGGTRLAFRAYKNERGNNTDHAGMYLEFNNDDTMYAYCPTPPNNSNNTRIATTAFVNTKLDSYLPLSGGTMTGEIQRSGIAVKNTVDNSYTQYNGGTDDTSSYICIYGKNHSSNSGVINIRAYNGTNSSYLKLTPTGDLTWLGKDVECVNAISSNYVRYESGLQICWGFFDGVTSTSQSVTFPVAFSSEPRVAIAPSSRVAYATNSYSTTKFNVFSDSTNSSSIRWIAIGKWK